MYVRIARFEGGERNWDEFAASVGETLRSGGQGTPFQKVADATKRVMLFVDRDEPREGENIEYAYERAMRFAAERRHN